MTLEKELNLLNELWEHVEKEHLKNLRQKKEKELEDKKNSLVYFSDGEGEEKEWKRKGKSINEPSILTIEFALFSDKTGKGWKVAEKLIGIKELNNLLSIKKKITELENWEVEIKNESDAIKKAELIKSALTYILKEIDDKNSELKAEIEKILNPDKTKKETEAKEEIKKAPNIPNILRDKKKVEPEEENYEIEKIPSTYDSIRICPENSVLFEYLVPSQRLPSRLYKINRELENDKVIKIKENDKIDEGYAILSYVWGGKFEKIDIKNEDGDFIDRKMSEGGKKSLEKARRVCLSFEIKYLWMDQLCINQRSREEKEKEVKKMGQYYSNATVTLIAIHKNVKSSQDEEWDKNFLGVLEKIINSKWFSRSWTFQEGWLSKKTLFMFDDMLIDGSFLAQVWAFNQQADVDGKYISRKQLEEKSEKIATPIGWVHYKNTYTNQDKLTLNLHEALVGIKHRGRGIPVDGIYSILGLLPYGENIKVTYKEDICKECWEYEKEKKESMVCVHEEKTKWPTYFKKDLEKIFLDVIKEIVENGYAEPLVWHGSEIGWIPRIDKEGSTRVLGGISIKKVETKDMEFDKETKDKKVIKLRDVVKYKINHEIKDKMIGIGGDSIGGGSYQAEINVKSSTSGRLESIKIWGIKKTLENIEESNWLLIPKKWVTDKPFAIIAKNKGSDYIRVGLVELEKEQRDILTEEQGNEVTIYLDNDTGKEITVTSPVDWNNKMTSKDELDGWKSKFAGETPEALDEKLTLSKQEINNLELQIKLQIKKVELYQLISRTKNKLDHESSCMLDYLLGLYKDNEETLKNKLKEKFVTTSIVGKVVNSLPFFSDDELAENEVDEICKKQTELVSLEKVKENQKESEANEVSDEQSDNYQNQTEQIPK